MATSPTSSPTSARWSATPSCAVRWSRRRAAAVATRGDERGCAVKSLFPGSTQLRLGVLLAALCGAMIAQAQPGDHGEQRGGMKAGQPDKSGAGAAEDRAGKGGT